MKWLHDPIVLLLLAYLGSLLLFGKLYKLW